MNKMHFLSILLVFLTLLTQANLCRATQSIVLTDDVQMSLGNAFMADGDYYRAITEYKKLAILFPESGSLPEALYQIGMSYYRGKDYENAIKSFVKVRQLYAAEYFSSAAFYEGLCYTKLAQYDAAALAFERSRLFDANHRDAINAQLGLALNALEKNDIAGSRSKLEQFLVDHQSDERAPEVRASLSLLDEYGGGPRKSPVLAGAMSAVLPGSGQLYAGQYKDGLMAFVVNGLFIAGTVAALDDENYALAAIVGGIGLPFYAGNIYGAANSARKWNLSLARDLQNTLTLRWDYHF